jgi:hypothetical protein
MVRGAHAALPLKNRRTSRSIVTTRPRAATSRGCRRHRLRTPGWRQARSGDKMCLSTERGLAVSTARNCLDASMLLVVQEMVVQEICGRRR